MSLPRLFISGRAKRIVRCWHPVHVLWVAAAVTLMLTLHLINHSFRKSYVMKIDNGSEKFLREIDFQLVEKMSKLEGARTTEATEKEDSSTYQEAGKQEDVVKNKQEEGSGNGKGEEKTREGKEEAKEGKEEAKEEKERKEVADEEQIENKPREAKEIEGGGKREATTSREPLQATTSHDPSHDPHRFQFIHSRKRMNPEGRPKMNTILDDVKFLLDPKGYACPREDDPLVLVLVMTAPKNVDRRQFIRETWGHTSWYRRHTHLRVVFVVGEPKEAKVQKDLDKENADNKDLLQYSFIDSYANLTYKTVSLLSWATSRCPDVTFYAKVDDDVFINPFHLKDYLLRKLADPPTPMGVRPGDEVMPVPLGSNPAVTYIYGRYDAEPYPLRDTKWALSLDEYPEKFYPPFVHGPAYIVGREAAKELLRFVPFVPFVKLEDVYTTGLVAHAAMIKHVQIFGEVSTFNLNDKLYNGTQAILEETGPKKKEEAWSIIKELGPKEK